MIGVGIITCDRPEFFKECLASINRNEVDFIVVVDDGNVPVELEWEEKLIKIRHQTPRQGVGVSKHDAVVTLLQLECEHIFLIEDDIKVIKKGVFDRYIETYEKTGIEHLMFAYHGPANKNGISGGEPAPKYRYCMGSYDNGGGLIISINQHCVGAFCYYTRNCFDTCGNFDLEYHNAFEHIEHSHRIAQAGLTTGYWNWADISNSCEYLAEQACSEENSSIRGNPDWSDNIQKGIDRFIKTYNEHPFKVRDTPEEEIRNTLKKLHTKANGKL
jgi:GT2 family glycosyltransferase